MSVCPTTHTTLCILLYYSSEILYSSVSHLHQREKKNKNQNLFKTQPFPCMKHRERTTLLLHEALFHGSLNFLAWTLHHPKTPQTTTSAATATATETETEAETKTRFFMGSNQEPLNLQTGGRFEGSWPFQRVLEDRVFLQLHMQLQRRCSWEHTCGA